LLRKFKEVQADRAEQDRVVGALRAMLRDSGQADARIDTAVDKVGPGRCYWPRHRIHV
jgi:hypothetical protein